MEITPFEYESDVPEDFTGICQHPLGTLVWYKDGKVHRENGPAIIYHTGERRWYWKGAIVSMEEVFENLSEEDKMKAIWEMDQWKS